MFVVPMGSLWCVVDKRTGDPEDCFYAATTQYPIIGKSHHIILPEGSIVLVVESQCITDICDKVSALFDDRIVWIYADSFRNLQLIESMSYLKRVA
jgi:hypothetical protein